jgi:hypothetical protein
VNKEEDVWDDGYNKGNEDEYADDGYNKGNKDGYAGNHEPITITKKHVILFFVKYFLYLGLLTSTSKVTKSQHLKTDENQEIHSNIVSTCLILSSISYDSNITKIEIYSKKHKAVLKNHTGSVTLDPINYTYINGLANKIQFPKFVPVDLEDAMIGPVSPLGFLMDYQIFENQILRGNKLKVAKLYYKFRLLEAGLPVVAPFYDTNSGISKSIYYKDILETLKIIVQQNSTSIPTQFCYSSIKGALDLDSYLEKCSNIQEALLGIETNNIKEQILLLQKVPHLPFAIFDNQNLDKETSLQQIEQQINTFNKLMSTCYKTINNVDITSYAPELSRRVSLRTLYEFEQAYNYLKQWIIKFAVRQKGVKVISQVNALLLKRISIYHLLNIDQKESNSQVQQIIDKTNKKTIESDEVTIQMPGFSGNISARKLQTFTTSGPWLVELLETLNNNWTTLDLIDDITITWLENFRKEEWVEFIKYIKR